MSKGLAQGPYAMARGGVRTRDLSIHDQRRYLGATAPHKYSINTVQANLGKSKVKRRAVVQTVSYEGMNQGRCRSGRKGTSNHPKLAKLIVAGPCQRLEMFSKGQLLI